MRVLAVEVANQLADVAAEGLWDQGHRVACDGHEAATELECQRVSTRRPRPPSARCSWGHALSHDRWARAPSDGADAGARPEVLNPTRRAGAKRAGARSPELSSTFDPSKVTRNAAVAAVLHHVSFYRATTDRRQESPKSDRGRTALGIDLLGDFSPVA